MAAISVFVMRGGLLGFAPGMKSPVRRPYLTTGRITELGADAER